MTSRAVQGSSSSGKMRSPNMALHSELLPLLPSPRTRMRRCCCRNTRFTSSKLRFCGAARSMLCRTLRMLVEAKTRAARSYMLSRKVLRRWYSSNTVERPLRSRPVRGTRRDVSGVIETKDMHGTCALATQVVLKVLQAL